MLCSWWGNRDCKLKIYTISRDNFDEIPVCYTADFFFFKSSYAQDDLKRKTDSVTRLIQQYYNKKDFVAIYGMGGESLKKSMDEKTFVQTMQGLHTQLGNFAELSIQLCCKPGELL